jgi:hypothetical protein
MHMQLNKESLNKLLMQSDEQLWQTIKMIASSAGFKLDKAPSPSEMQALRAALSGASDDDIKFALGKLGQNRGQQ